jgi:hypothetical protein
MVPLKEPLYQTTMLQMNEQVTGQVTTVAVDHNTLLISSIGIDVNIKKRKKQTMMSQL